MEGKEKGRKEVVDFDERTPFFMGLQTNIFFNGIHLAELPRILRGTFTKGGLMTGDHC